MTTPAPVPNAGLIARTLDNLPYSGYHRRIILALAVVGFIESYATAITGALVVSAGGEMHFTAAQTKMVVIAPTLTLVLSMLAGALYLSDRFSRRTILLIGAAWSTLFTLLTPLADTPELLIAVRLVAGLGYGLALPAAYPLGAELLPANRRHTFAWIYEIALGIGFTLTSIIGVLVAHLGAAGAWRLLPLPGGIFFFIAPPLIWFLVPESPRWLAQRGRNAEALRVLARLCRKAGVHPPEEPVSAADAIVAPQLPRFGELFARGTRRRLAVAAAAWAGCLVPFYIFTTLLPEIFVHEGYVVASSLALTIAVFAVTIPGKAVNGYLTEKIGRRATIAGSLLLSAIGVLLLIVGHGITMLIIAEVIIGLTTLSATPAIRLYMAEQFPTRLRGRGYFFVECTVRFVAGVPVPFLLAGLLDAPAVIFAVAGACVVLGGIVVASTGIETRGSLESVEAATPRGAGELVTD